MENKSDLPFLGELLIKKGLVNYQDLQKAIAFQKGIGGRLGSILVRIGAISENNLLNTLSQILQIRLLDNQSLPADPQVFCHAIEKSGIEPDWWLDQEVLVWESSDNHICCIARDIIHDTVYEVLGRVFRKRKKEFYFVHSYDLERIQESVFRSYSTNTSATDNDIDQLRELAEEAPVIEFVNNLFAQAFDQGASDVHIEPEARIFEVRFRVDGVLHTRFSLPKERFAAVSSRIKLISGMDISERRLPQDGRLSLRLSGSEVDIRASAIPGVFGESLVLRLLPKEGGIFDIERLGLRDDNLRMLRKWIHEPHGIILVTGPTGSGKSTTLYAAIESINDKSKKIVTVEDPVEYQIGGITQIQTHGEIGYTFARALRSILRHDPDVILIGEIRDGETSGIAVQAALTGHLVLSTLHTNDAVSAFTRLINMGVEPFLVAAPVRAVLAQRLVRKLCPDCSEASEPVSDIQEISKKLLQEERVQERADWRKAKGCAKCRGTGYIGREGIYELVEVTPELQHLILSGGTEAAMRKLAAEQGSRTLREDGFLKARQGITSVEEVLRVTAG